jgi:hypothetical protein
MSLPWRAYSQGAYNEIAVRATVPWTMTSAAAMVPVRLTFHWARVVDSPTASGGTGVSLTRSASRATAVRHSRFSQPAVRHCASAPDLQCTSGLGGHLL